MIYELIALRWPYSNLPNDKARLAQLYMQQGRRPRLTSKVTNKLFTFSYIKQDIFSSWFIQPFRMLKIWLK